MKTKYYLATGVLACSAVSGLVMPLANTFAVGTGSQTQDVTVGEVDETVYSVDINWGDMTFDWKYNAQTNRFGFQNYEEFCVPTGVMPDGVEWLENEKNNGNIYSDELCTNVLTLTDEIASDTTYYHHFTRSAAQINVGDSSINGYVKVKADFTPTDNYSWVNGRFSSVVFIDEQGGYLQDLDDGYLEVVGGAGSSEPDGPGRIDLNGILYLEGDSAHITSDSVHAGDKIGTVTLTIEPDLN